VAVRLRWRQLGDNLFLIRSNPPNPFRSSVIDA